MRCGNATTPTQPSASATAAASHFGASTQSELEHAIATTQPLQTIDSMTTAQVGRQHEQAERRVRAGDQEVDRRVVEPAHPAPATGGRQGCGGRVALTPNIVASAPAKTAVATISLPLDAIATSAAPATSERKNAYWCETPRRLGLMESSTISLPAIAVDDPSPGEVVGRQLDLDPIARKDPDPVAPHLPGRIAERLMAIVEHDAVHTAAEGLDDLPLELDFLSFSSPAR